jgi:UPF0755 protein
MKRLLRVLIYATAAAVTAAIAGFFWLNSTVSAPVGPPDAPDVELTVAKGMTGRTLGPVLAGQKLIKSPFGWRFFLWRRGALNPKAGRHLVSARMTLPQLAEVLEAPPLVEDQPFVVVEGWRLRDTDKALAEKGWCKSGAYIQAASNPSHFHASFPLPTTTLEGYLYPETYRVPVGEVDLNALIQRQLDMFGERFVTPHQADLAASGRTLEQVVIMASMLEREEPVPANRAIVAGILWKRFDKGTPLGVDATSRYLLDEWNDKKGFLVRLRDPNDPWNSRTRAGLPPGPLGAPTLDSLLAAAHPEQNAFWYYLHDANKQLHPSRNAAEHEALRARFNVY